MKDTSRPIPKPVFCLHCGTPLNQPRTSIRYFCNHRCQEAYNCARRAARQTHNRPPQFGWNSKPMFLDI